MSMSLPSNYLFLQTYETANSTILSLVCCKLTDNVRVLSGRGGVVMPEHFNYEVKFLFMLVYKDDFSYSRAVSIIKKYANFACRLNGTIFTYFTY